jgi:type II secretory pathway pseudopilin PulG
MTRAAFQFSGRQRSFTLVEALAVVVIVGIVIPVVMAGLSLASGAAGLARQRAGASELASNKLAELVYTSQWQSAQSGDEGDPPRVYHWASRIEDWTEPTLHQLTVEVTWTTRGKTRSLAMSTLVYDGGNSNE